MYRERSNIRFIGRHRASLFPESARSTASAASLLFPRSMCSLRWFLGIWGLPGVVHPGSEEESWVCFIFRSLKANSLVQPYSIRNTGHALLLDSFGALGIGSLSFLIHKMRMVLPNFRGCCEGWESWTHSVNVDSSEQGANQSGRS